jgi:hypothetical protein
MLGDAVARVSPDEEAFFEGAGISRRRTLLLASGWLLRDSRRLAGRSLPSWSGSAGASGPWPAAFARCGAAGWNSGGLCWGLRCGCSNSAEYGGKK